MGLSLSTILSETNKFLKFNDTNFLSTEDRESIIRDALKEYSRLRPIRQVTAMTGTDSGIYDLPADFEDGFSICKEVEYPINQTPKEIIDEKYWFLDDFPTGRKFRFEYYNPGAGNTWWLKYTKRHVFDSNDDSTIPTADLTAMAYLCTSLMCDALSTFFASKANPNLSEVEIVGYNTRVTEYTTKANSWRKKFDDIITTDTTGIHGEIDFSQEMWFDRNVE